MKKRDLSEEQFRYQMQKLGFKSAGFMGYWHLPEPCANVSVCRFNAGERRRDQLAYMKSQFKRCVAQQSAPN